jgi:hypothetical protein
LKLANTDIYSTFLKVSPLIVVVWLLLKYKMAFNYPHFPHAHLNVVRDLPNGHWFFNAFDRLRRTPEAEEIMAEGPSEGLVRLTEEEFRAALGRAIDSKHLASTDSCMGLTSSCAQMGIFPTLYDRLTM